jgi:hypothetical protein
VVSHHTANCLDLIKVIKLKKKNSSKKKIQKQNPEEGNKIATVGQTLCTKANMKPETKLEMEDLK